MTAHHPNLTAQDITIYGDGSQTRSLCYVQDLIDGLILLMNADVDEQPVNLGNEGEATIAQWANMIIDTVQDVLADAMPALADRPRPALKFCPLPQDDPPRRRPDWSVEHCLSSTDHAAHAHASCSAGRPDSRFATASRRRRAI